MNDIYQAGKYVINTILYYVFKTLLNLLIYFLERR